MRFLGMGDSNELGDLYLRLGKLGHSVRVYVGDPESRDVLANQITVVSAFEPHLSWIKEAGSEGAIVFESATSGSLQDQLRSEGFQVVGCSEWGSRLETDRLFGQSIMRRMGLNIAATHEFHGFDQALNFLKEHPQRYVFKMNGGDFASTRGYVAELEDGRDMAAYLRILKSHWRYDHPPDFVLMEFIQGVEMGVGAYFNGTRFLLPACLDWEHKRFFPGDLGELTGEMGTLVTYQDTEKFFKATLGRLENELKTHGYRGYINLNTIVNASGIWPLEFTCRFGYPGYSVLSVLQQTPWPDLLAGMATGGIDRLDAHAGYAVGVVLTVPPFPYLHGYAALSKGYPICFRTPLTEDEFSRVHWGEVDGIDGQWVTAGVMGNVMTVTGRGETVAQAQEAAYRLAKKVIVPNLRYRIDIGDKYLRTDCALLRTWGH